MHLTTAKQIVIAGTGYGAPIAIKDPEVWVNPTVIATPGALGTMTVQWTGSSEADVAAGTANWMTWVAGTVSVATSDSLVGAARFVRASAATTNGVLELCQ